MQICSPPITTARLHAYSGEDVGQSEPEDSDLTYVFTTIYDRNGITKGLAYDIAAATLRPNIGDERIDLEFGWHFFLTYGVEVDSQSNESKGFHGSDESDDRVKMYKLESEGSEKSKRLMV